jgi:hypothetical protein
MQQSRRNVSGLIVWSAMYVALAAVQQSPSATSAAPHTPWRPLHKGGAYLSTGVYIREDDDLVVDTPFPIVLRRTYNSADGHARQFGANATHAGEWWIYGKSDPRAVGRPDSRGWRTHPIHEDFAGRHARQRRPSPRHNAYRVQRRASEPGRIAVADAIARRFDRVVL